MRPGAFFDRDGVLNVDFDYVHRPDQWVWFKGAREALTLAKEAGYAIVVVTNQSGIGRGFYTQEHVNELHDFVQRETGGMIDGFYHCPHLPEDGCQCRKPLPGMIEQAIEDLNIDRTRSFLIGDRSTDIDAAHAAGIAGYLFDGSDLVPFVDRAIRETQPNP